MLRRRSPAGPWGDTPACRGGGRMTSKDMRFGPTKPFLSPIVWAFICALAMRCVLPAGVMISAQASAAPAVVICTGSGPVEMVVDHGKLKPVEHKGGDKGRTHDICPFASAHQVLTPAFAPVEPVPRAIAWVDPELKSPAAKRGALPIRAPPPPSQAPPTVLA